MAQINIKQCVIRLADKNGTNHIDVKIGEGNLTYSEKKPRKYIKDRGLLDSVRDDDDDPLELKLDATWEFITSASGEPITIEDALKQRNGASGWVTTSDDTCEPYALDVILIYTPVCPGVDPETLTFPDFRYESIEHDLKAGTFAISGKCNVTEPTPTRG